MVGVDDGAFARGDRFAPLAAVVVSVPEHLEATRLGKVRVDGTDGTAGVLRLLRELGPLDGIRAVLIDGAVVGGFNVLDLDVLHRATRVPVVAVTRRPPDFARIARALRRWFPRSAERRLALLRQHRLHPVPTGGEPILAAASGCSAADAAWLVRRATVRGYWPEPLRLAHLIASAGRAGQPLAQGPVARRRGAGRRAVRARPGRAAQRGSGW